MLKTVLAYVPRTFGVATFSAVALLGIQQQAVSRACDPATPLPWWGFMGMVALVTMLILMWMSIGDSRANRQMARYN